MDSALTHFLRSFERNSNSENSSEAVTQFADVFLVAAPEGVTCVRSVDFASAMPKRKLLFDQYGWQSTELMDVRESWLDARYALVSTRWRFSFRNSVGELEPIEANSTYLIDTGTERFQIVFYLPHQNIIEVLQKRHP
jgi:hypothetical protein